MQVELIERSVGHLPPHLPDPGHLRQLRTVLPLSLPTWVKVGATLLLLLVVSEYHL